MAGRTFGWLLGIGVILVVGLVFYLHNLDPSFEPGSKALVVGDSITFQSSNVLSRVLAADGWRPTVEAVPGAAITGGGFSNVDWPAQLKSLARFVKPDVAVVELGTNGCGDCTTLAAAIDDVMHELRDQRLVLWLNVRDPAPIPKYPRLINQALEDAAGRWDNLRILDMDAFFDDHPEYIGGDGVHPTQAGNFAYSEFISDALGEYLAK